MTFRNVQRTHAVRGSNHMFRIQTKKWSDRGTHGNGRSIQCLKDQLGPKISLVECRYQKVTAGGGPLWISNSCVYHVNPWKMLCHLGSLSVFWQETSKINKTRPISFFRCFNLFALFISFTVCFRMQQRMTAHDGLSPWLDTQWLRWLRADFAQSRSSRRKACASTLAMLFRIYPPPVRKVFASWFATSARLSSLRTSFP